MKPRTLAILLVLVAGLGAFVWFYERERPGSEERERLAKRVLGVEHEQIARLELHAGDRVTELVRTRKADSAGEDAAGNGDAGGAAAGPGDQDEWRLRRPIDFRADYWQVDGLVRSLAELERVRELEDYEPSDVGLDQPRGRVVVELEGGATKELEIGAEVPGSGNLIVAVKGEPGASVVAGSLWASVEKEAAEWRDKDLFVPEREAVRELTIERAGGTEGGVRLARDGDDFALAEPIRDRADDDAVNALLRELTGLRASAFLEPPPPLQEIGLDPPRARLTVALGEGEPFVLLWGDRKEGAEESYAKVGDLVVTTAAALDESFGRTAADWRSRSWSSLPVFAVDEVTVTDAAGTLTVTRDEGSWRRGEDAIEYGSVSELLYAIDDAVAERIATPEETAALALGQPELTVRLAAFDEEAAGEGEAAGKEEAAADGEGSSQREALELFAPTADDLVPARAEGRDAILLLRLETRDQILARLEAVRAAKPAGEEAPPEPESSAAPAEPEPDPNATAGEPDPSP